MQAVPRLPNAGRIPRLLRLYSLEAAPMLRTLLSALSLALAASFAPAQGLIGDFAAKSAAMFRATGPYPCMVGVEAEAVLGKNFVIGVNADPKYIAAGLFIGNKATRGRSAIVGLHELLIYTGGVFWVPGVPLTNGRGQVSLPLPFDETLIGDDVTIQALAITSKFEIGASNLAIANVGATTLGAAIFGFLTTARHDPQALDDWIKDNATRNSQPLEAFCNGSRSDSFVVVNLKTKRRLVVGESVEVWVGPTPNSAVRQAVIVQDEATIAVRVPPGSYLYFQHVGGKATLQFDYNLSGPMPFTSTHIGGNGSYHTYTDSQSKKQTRFLFCNPTNFNVKMRMGWRLKRALTTGEMLELHIGRSPTQITRRVPINQQQQVTDITVGPGEYVYLWHKGNASLGVDWEILKG